MTPQLEISIEGSLGAIALNRPEAINALSREMIDGIFATLSAWRDDPAIRVVLFEGRGPRGFCAGGDVRAARSLVLLGTPEEADAYFAAEYAMNALIATFPKPIAALGQGAIMGGGIGIFGHARFSFAGADAKFAMPEAAIGFVADVGVNAILSLAPPARALAFLMSGISVGLGDAITLGLCDVAVPEDRMAIVRAGIVAAATSANPDTALVQLMQSEGVEPGEASLCADADALAGAFAEASAAEIAAALFASPDPRAEKLSATLATRSPTSLEAILQGHRAARRAPDIDAILAIDHNLAAFMVRQPDFAEGVRAVLVDKDKSPSWQPKQAENVDSAGITGALARI